MAVVLCAGGEWLKKMCFVQHLDKMNIPSDGLGFKVPSSFINIVLDFTISQIGCASFMAKNFFLPLHKPF